MNRPVNPFPLETLLTHAHLVLIFFRLLHTHACTEARNSKPIFIKPIEHTQVQGQQQQQQQTSGGGGVQVSTTVTVVCDRPGSGSWPSGGFKVNVSASAGVDGCSGSNWVETTVGVVPKPVVELTVPTVPQESCSDQKSVSFYVQAVNNGDESTEAITLSLTGAPPELGTCSITPSQVGEFGAKQWAHVLMCQHAWRVGCWSATTSGCWKLTSP